MQTRKFDVHGMTCGGYTGGVQRALSKIAGVSHVAASLSPGSASMEVDTTRVTPGQIEAAIGSLGYGATLQSAKSGSTS